MTKNYIAGEWVAAAEASPNINPSNTGDVLGRVSPARRAAEAERAIAAAYDAFPAWSRSTIQLRHDILKARRRRDPGAQGRARPPAVARGGQDAARGHRRGRARRPDLPVLRRRGLRLAGDKLPSVRPGVDVEITREPVGVVGLITPWNFPIAIPAWKIAPALAYGNCVVLKPAELVPGSAHALAEIIIRAGVPAGVFNLVMGRGSVVGEAMLQSPNVAAISFTGSVATGRRVAADLHRRRPDEEGPARDGRQEPAGRARRRRPEGRGRVRRQRRLLLDRPALHRLLAPDRHRGHPRPLRRGDARADEGPGRSTMR